MSSRRRLELAAGCLAVVLAACAAPIPSPIAAPGSAPPPRAATSESPAPAAAGPASPSVTAPAGATPPIRWTRGGVGLEVGVLEVPLDHVAAGGEQIVIPLARRAATDPSRRIGTLLYIAGGPGEAGTDFVQSALDMLIPAEILERFDLVSFDPRGTPSGTGNPRVSCPLEAAELAELESLAPADQAALEVDDVLAAVPIIRAACERGSGALLKHLDTASTVGDIERIRLALGEEQLSLMGGSWGTLAGALYAEAHPDRVRALVLNAPLDPANDQLAVTRDTAEARQAALDAFLAWCATTPSCAFHSDGDPRAALDALAASLVRAPGRVGAYDLTRALVIGLEEHTWAEIANALDAARAGQPATMAAWAGHVGPSALVWYRHSVTCPDLAAPQGATAYARLADDLRSSAPDFATDALRAAWCVGWPQAPARTIAPVRAVGAPPILILSGIGDVVTPHAWAQALEQELDDATLLARASTDHGSLFRGDACIDAAFVDYLVDLAAPVKGTICD
jgi:pimeloyl-ACP methyl ester carboxylesterase